VITYSFNNISQTFNGAPYGSNKHYIKHMDVIMYITRFLCALPVLAKIILAEILVMVQTAAGTTCHYATAYSTARHVPT